MCVLTDMEMRGLKCVDECVQTDMEMRGLRPAQFFTLFYRRGIA